MSADVLSNLVITKVHSVLTQYTPQNAGASRKDRPRWAVILKYEGETVYTTNGKRVLSDSHHAVVLPKGCDYEWVCTKAGHYSVIEFDGEATYGEPIGFYVKNYEKLLKIFRELEYKRARPDLMIGAESIRDTYSALLLLAQSNSEKYVPSDKQQKLLPAIEYILQNYNGNITNDILAAEVGMSTVYFRKLFTEIMGVSPIAYVKELRIQKAKEVLASDYDTLSDVARSLGYSSLYDFSRDFKKHVGVAPSRYEGRSPKA